MAPRANPRGRCRCVTDGLPSTASRLLWELARASRPPRTPPSVSILCCGDIRCACAPSRPAGVQRAGEGAGAPKLNRAMSTKKTFKKILAANRGEIAIRIMRAAAELNIRTTGIFAYEDRFCPHRYKADESYLVCAPAGRVRPVSCLTCGFLRAGRCGQEPCGRLPGHRQHHIQCVPGWGCLGSSGARLVHGRCRLLLCAVASQKSVDCIHPGCVWAGTQLSSVTHMVWLK